MTLFFEHEKKEFWRKRQSLGDHLRYTLGEFWVKDEKVVFESSRDSPNINVIVPSSENVLVEPDYHPMGTVLNHGVYKLERPT